MNRHQLEPLKLDGYAPRTVLDIGANVGDFTRGFLEVFPDCVPTLIEPNPYCEAELAKLPFERHMAAASDATGEATLFLSRDWLQTTGASLYRENSHYFSDELAVEQTVPKVRIDDLLAGRRFDFVKIDTQGSELDVLRGGETVLRQADYILLELSVVDFNQGAPQAEAVLVQLAAMGFAPAAVTNLHRLEDVRDGGVLQLDMLFKRRAARPSQFSRLTTLNELGVIAYRRAANIVKIEAKKDKVEQYGAPDPAAYTQAEEKALASALDKVAGESGALVAKEDFAGAMRLLAGLRAPVDAFFDKVTVNAPEKELRANRLALLQRLAATMDKIADFSKIEG